MAYAAGSRLGRYEIRGLLGAGGMGEVYRAWDDRLEREVAIKVLRGEASGDQDLQRRFAQEARAASALNHPNILTVHDVGVEGEAQYIVSELVEGESLGDIVQRGPVPLRKALDVAAQVAAGLAAAHGAGIIHRDMKPANIMITREGTAKILDFGVAKSTRAQAAAAPAETQTGMIIGTAAYMSPEQARGEPLDFRTDQFSFGLILYRMFTGQPAFERSSTVGLMAAIVEEEPPAIANLAPGVPAQVRWCVERCLAKDRRDRYASTEDLHHELRTIKEHISEITTQPRPALETKSPRKGRLVRWALAAAVALAAGLALAAWLIQAGAGVNLADYRLRPLATDGVYEAAPAWSPDGRQIAYTADVAGVRQIYVRSLDAAIAAQLTQSKADCGAPFWAPDGARVFFMSGTALWSVAAAGGSPQLVQEGASTAALARDGSALAFLRLDPTGKEPLSLWIAKPVGSAPRRYTAGPFATRRYRDGWLEFSPDGAVLGAWLAQWNGRSEFWLLPQPAGEPRQSFGLLQGAYPFHWMPDNRHVVFGGVVPGTLGADLQLADTRAKTLRPLTVTTEEALLPAVSPDGRTIAFTVGYNDFDLIEIPLDGSGTRPLLATSRNEFDPTFSPVADQYAYTSDRAGTQQIWLRSRQGDWERPVVTAHDFPNAWIVSLSEASFAPDGQRIAYTAVGSQGHVVYVSNVKGGSPLRLAGGAEPYQRSPSWNPDGGWIAFLQNVNGRWALAKVRTGGGDQPTILRDGCLRSHPKWSKRGDWITCATTDGLTLVSADGQTSKVASRDAWLVHGWSADGAMIYGVKADPEGRRFLASIDVDRGVEKNIAELKIGRHSEMGCYTLSRDGAAFATSLNQPRADIWTLTGYRLPGSWMGFLKLW